MILWLILAAVLCFGLGAWLGAPYLPILARDAESLLDLAEVTEGAKIIDLGSGDGRLLRAAARRGASGTGYEINPLLWLYSVIRSWPQRRQIKFYLRNYWDVTLPQADVVYVFLIARFMAKLDAKLKSEVTTPTRLVSYIFTIPGLRSVRSTKNCYLYHYPNL